MNKGFSLTELLVVVAIMGIISVIGVIAYVGFSESGKQKAVIANHNEAVSWLEMKAVECEGSGRITYLKNCSHHKGCGKDKLVSQSCIYPNTWTLMMELGYNHIRHHFRNDYYYNSKNLNPWHRGSHLDAMKIQFGDKDAVKIVKIFHTVVRVLHVFMEIILVVFGFGQI